MQLRRPALAAALAASALLSLSGCGSSKGSANAASAPSSSPQASGPSSADATNATNANVTNGTAPNGTAPNGTAPSSATHSSAPAHTTAPGANSSTTSDTYAYTHPCDPQSLSIHVTGLTGAPTQRVIEVHNTGATSCGLSYFPQVDLGNSRSADQSGNVKPLVPGGLGGAPAYALSAGHSAYAVVDIDPSGATSGTVAGIDEINVLADRDHMPLAATVNFPLGAGANVLRPKLGLYEASVQDAVTSMRSASVQAS